MYFQLGWRNIWRNRRRTLVILTAVIIGVWSMVFLGALMRGIGDQMVRHGISTLTGHIQIHHKGYRSDPVIENSITMPKAVEEALSVHLPPGSHWSERVRVNAIASNAHHSTGITLVGIDPLKEGKVSFIDDAVRKGRYLDNNDMFGIMVGEALAEDLETSLDRKLVLMSEDSTGEIASRAFRIRGIFQAEMESTEKRFAFVTRPAAQEMLKLGEGISEVCIFLPSHSQVHLVAGSLRNELSSERFEVHTWEELMPLVTAVLNMYNGFIFLWYLAVFIAMGFGIVNTSLMAVFERMWEFGLLRALGLKPLGIIKEVLIESFFLLVMGMAAGNVLGLVSIFALSDTGIDLSSLAAGIEYAGFGTRIIYPSIHLEDLVTANAVVFILGLVVSLYPAVKAARFTPVQAMAHT